MTSSQLTNRTFDQIEVGEQAELTQTIGKDDLALCAAFAGGTIPTAVGGDGPAPLVTVGQPVDHATWTGNLISAVLSSRLPGPGTVCLDQQFRFRLPVKTGDTVTARLRVTGKTEPHHIVTLDILCLNQRGEHVIEGTATVIAPVARISWQPGQSPEVVVLPQSRYAPFIAEARSHPMIPAGIVHPCSRAAILGAAEVRDEGLLSPLLIGPEARIRATAEEAGVSLEGMEIVPTEHSHAAAACAVSLAASGRVSMLVKGSLHSDELLGAVIAKSSGLRTDRRISHIYAMDVPAYGKPVIVTDAAINILPTLEHKRDICQNAVDLLHLLGMEQPRVAVLAAVETVNPAMPATLEAAALTVMAARGQITGALVDGPLAFDNAISPEAALTKGITSPVAGQADVLLVPDLEAGNMLAKQLIYFAGATAAGLVLGARVPIVLTSRSDPLSARIASAALAKLAVIRKAEKGRI